MRIKFILFQITFLIIILSSFLFNIYEHNKSIEKQAINVVETLIEKDIALRAWIAEKGGIYVKVSDTIQPNKHLKFMKNRDLYVNDLNLTLMNPAYVLREVLEKYDSQLVNAKTKLTSKKYLNPHNKPNDWEKKALEKLEKNKSKYTYEFISIKEKPYLKYMKGFETKESCLKCHEKQGYKLGDIRGGISVALSLENFYDTYNKDKSIMLISHIIFWLIGATILELFYLSLQRELKNKIEQERILAKQFKYATIGEMTSMIAHQWRQPLNALGLIIQDLPEAYDAKELTKDYLEHQVSSSFNLIDRMSKTIDDFMNFFKPDKGKSSFDLDELIEDIKKIVTPQFKNKNINIIYNYETKNITITSYKREIEHILLNLLANSRDAFENNQISDKNIIIKINKLSDYMVISVEDNAGGINENIIERIFEPYFTTKDEGKGTGLGLYMTKQIIEKSLKGEVEVKNIDNGVKFTIKLPMI